jgi:hypothetical protein
MRESTRQKHIAIRAEYQKWDSKRYKGVRIYSEAYIFKKLSEKFFMTPTYIENIVYSRIPVN